jgi:AcrR family transcriptional regulator
LSGRAGSEIEDQEEFPRPPLPRGRHRLSAEAVADDQRRRLVAAMVESVAIRGYAATSVARVIELAGVSRGTFYEQFENRRECLLVAYDTVSRRFLAWVSDACAVERLWEDKVVAAIGAVVEFAVVYPADTRLLTLDALAVDAEAARHGLVAADRLAEMLRSGREHRRSPRELPEVTEQALVGAVASTISWRLLDGESLAGLKPQLIQLVLTPYVGPAAAARRAAKATVPSQLPADP